MPALASYAAHPEESRGRLYEEPACPTRTVYQRDRDRIVHSTAFRRLIHKTQVFIYHEGDHYRTRLTHSLEVAQIARTLARSLDLNEDLVETVALAHDLGHTPFGHAGENALNEAMQAIGGFDHNAQSLRIVTHLEHRYAAFRGLNLTWETLEGIVKHNGPLTRADGRPLGRYAEKGLPHAIREFAKLQDLGLDTYCSLEGQIAAVSDDIAYNNHDIDDGFRAGYIAVKELEAVPMAGRAIAAVRAAYGDIPGATTGQRDEPAHDRGDGRRRAGRGTGQNRSRRAAHDRRCARDEGAACGLFTGDGRRHRQLAKLPDGAGVPPSGHRGENGERAGDAARALRLFLRAPGRDERRCRAKRRVCRRGCGWAAARGGRFRRRHDGYVRAQDACRDLRQPRGKSA